MTWGEDGLRREEWVSAGGTWTGLLIENEHTGFPLSMVWTFAFEFEPVERDFGGTYPELVVDWAPLPGASWNSMTGRRSEALTFAHPVESSVYFLAHHRFDRSSVVVHEQEGSRLRVVAEVSGDIDDLGLDQVSVEAWLNFGGIYVQPEIKPTSVEAARELLEKFTDTSGLVGVEQQTNYWFNAAAAAGSGAP